MGSEMCIRDRDVTGPYIVKPNGSELDLVVQNATPSLFSRILPTTEETSNAIRAEIPSDNETDGEAESDWYEQYDSTTQIPRMAPNQGAVGDDCPAERPGIVEDIPPPPEPVVSSDKEIMARMNSRRRRARKKFGQRPTGNEHNVLTHYPKDLNCEIC